MRGIASTRPELVESLKEALKEALDFNRQDAVSAAGEDYEEEQIAV